MPIILTTFCGGGLVSFSAGSKASLMALKVLVNFETVYINEEFGEYLSLPSISPVSQNTMEYVAECLWL